MLDPKWKTTAVGRAWCRCRQQDNFQLPVNFTGSTPLKNTNGTMPYL
jgi:hypothetical protein